LLFDLAQAKNAIPLPPLTNPGLCLPPEESWLTAPNYQVGKIPAKAPTSTPQMQRKESTSAAPVASQPVKFTIGKK
jgi:hypothetical protein